MHIVVIQDGYTALHMASSSWDVEVVQLLLQYNADVNIENKVRNVILGLFNWCYSYYTAYIIIIF